MKLKGKQLIKLSALCVLGTIVCIGLILNATLQNPPEAVLGIIVGSGISGIISIAVGHQNEFPVDKKEKGDH